MGDDLENFIVKLMMKWELSGEYKELEKVRKNKKRIKRRLKMAVNSR
jgi:hypothetical protein